MKPRIVLKQLAFCGPNVADARLELRDGLNILYGASNTGKSFTVKTLDFMLGGSRLLPDITERRGYTTVSLGLLSTAGFQHTLARSISGGSTELFQGVQDTCPPTGGSRRLAERDTKGGETVSQFLLELIGLQDKRIVVDINGKTRRLSFRDLARHCVVDEITIQSEASPAQSGQHTQVTAEKSVFRMLLTGEDDSTVTEVVDARTFKVSTTARVEVLDELIASLDEELASFPSAEELSAQAGRLEATLASARDAADAANASVEEHLTAKAELVRSLSEREDRAREIEVTLSRFAQLDAIYLSDIERLNSLDQAGFVLLLDAERNCPLCGASPSDQKHDHAGGEIARVLGAAAAEIQKIERQRVELTHTVSQLRDERTALNEALSRARTELTLVEERFSRASPEAAAVLARLTELLEARDRAGHGLALLARKDELVAKREAALKAKRSAGSIRRPLASDAAHDFAQTVSKVLEAWGFPGKRHVSFDHEESDLRIDGKLRRDNGKGVRAITHSAFKVALLMFCHERDLPHPGFLILDTPLLTYRDPLRSRLGGLSPDEREIASTPLRERFFAHLAELKIGQVVIVENIDPPAFSEADANVQVFHGSDDRLVDAPARKRRGLFPVAASAA